MLKRERRRVAGGKVRLLEGKTEKGSREQGGVSQAMVCDLGVKEEHITWFKNCAVLWVVCWECFCCVTLCISYFETMFICLYFLIISIRRIKFLHVGDWLGLDMMKSFCVAALIHTRRTIFKGNMCECYECWENKRGRKRNITVRFLISGATLRYNGT